jgi:hypothetical protein
MAPMPALALALPDSPWLRSLGSADARVLWAILGAVVVFGLWGAVVGFRSRGP